MTGWQIGSGWDLRQGRGCFTQRLTAWRQAKKRRVEVIAALVLRDRQRDQLMRFQVVPPQNMPPRAQPCTLSWFGPAIAMVES